ncbi:MAG: cystathionine beta-lyase [Rickettsiales bacterium]
MTTLKTKLISEGRDSGDFLVPNPPTYRASTILFPDAESYDEANQGKGKTPSYGRYGTPTTWQLEEILNDLHGSDHTFLTSTGMSAVALGLQSFLKTGDHALIVDCVYGGTHPFCDGFLKHYGAEVTYFDPNIGAGIADLFKPNTKAVYLEAPGSLTFEMQDIAVIAQIAHDKGCIVLMDCTWATPLYFKPFDHGIDVVIHALTKYVGGHSDLMMGSVSCKKEHAGPIKNMYRWTAPTPSGDNVTLALRGIRTMAVRLEQQMKSALIICQWLEKQKAVKRILFPMLESNPHHALWKKYMTGGASLFAVEIDATRSALYKVINALEHFGIGASWGGFESLVIPFVPAENRHVTRWAKDQTLIRLHIGLEDPADLITDLEQAFSQLA